MAVSTCSRGMGGREGTSVGSAERPGESCESGEVGRVRGRVFREHSRTVLHSVIPTHDIWWVKIQPNKRLTAWCVHSTFPIMVLILGCKRSLHQSSHAQ